MKNRLIYLFVILNFSLLMFGQGTEQKKLSYLRFEGNIDTDISITANIVRLYDKLSGNYQYRFVEDGDKMYYGKTIELDGDIDDADNAHLKEFGRTEYAFTGILKNGVYKGKWNATENKKLDFVLNEYYPNGSMPFDVHYLHSEGNLVENDPTSPTAEIEMTLIYPGKKFINPDVVDSVKRFIANSFFGTGFDIRVPDSMLVRFENEYLSNYKKQNENWHQSGASFNWEKVISMSVIFNSNYILCLEYLKYAYSGGAHGMTNISYDIIHLDDGKLLTFADVFAEGSEEDLAAILTNQLRKDYSIPAEVKLTEAGFFVEQVKPNRNIYITGSGLGFSYNSYEIAPYSQGATNIFLKWSQIKDLINTGSPISQLSHR